MNPIPYNNMYTPGSPDNSGSSLTYDYGNSYTTSPTVTSYSTATTVTQPFANRNSLSTDSRTQWTADYSDNSITPLDVFPGRTYWNYRKNANSNLNSVLISLVPYLYCLFYFRHLCFIYWILPFPSNIFLYSEIPYP